MNINSEHNENFLTLASTINEPLLIVDANGKIAFVNPAYETLTGKSLESVKGELFEHPIETDANQPTKIELAGRQNTTITAEMKAQKITWNGQSAHLILLQNIAQEQEQEISDDIRKLSLVARKTNNGVILTDQNNKITWINKGFERISGYKLEEVKGKNPRIFQGPDTNPAHKSRIRKKLRERVPFTQEILNYHKDGHPYWIELRITPVFDDHGQIEMFIAVQSDVTDRKETEDALERSKKRFRKIFEIASLGIAQVDIETGNILLINSFYENITGYTKKELMNMSFKDLTHPEDREWDWMNFQKAAKQDTSYRSEKRYIRKDGTVIWVRLHVAFIRDKHNNPIRTVAICENVTERKETKLQLNERIKELKAFYELSHLAEDRKATMESILNKMADKLPQSMWLPEICACQIVYNGQHYQSDNFSSLPISTTAPLHVKGEKAGYIEIGYKEPPPLEAGQEPFLEEELAMISAIGEQLGRIIERFKADKALKESAQKLETIFNNITDAVYLHGITSDDKPGKFIEVNEVACQMLGYSREELLKLSPEDIDDPKYQTTTADNPMNKLLTNHSHTFISHHLTKDDQSIPVEINSQLFELDGERMILSVARDITEQIERKKALMASEENQRAMIEASPLAIIRIDKNGIVQTWNKAAERIFGWKEEEVFGKPIPFIPTDKQLESLKLRKRVLSGDHFINYEFKRLHKNGSLLDLSLSTAPIHDASGKVVSILGIFSDITERKQAEQQLKLQAAALDSAANAIVITDSNGTIQWVNSAWTSLTGYKQKEVHGKNPRILKSGYQSNEFYADLWNTLLNKEVWSNELINRKKDGTLYYEFQTITPITNEEGDVTHFIAIKQDISERKKMEDELRAALAEKSTLFQELYHRTHNNMQIISNMLSLQMIKTNSQELENIAQDITNRIQAMSLVHEKLYKSNNLSQIDLEDYLTSLFDELYSNLKNDNQQVTLNVQIPEITLLIDILSPCGLIFNELLTNSFEHSFPDQRDGTIFIKITEDEDDIITIKYSDNGLGLPADFDISQHAGMGFELVQMLVEYQLDGTFYVSSGDGFTCHIQFSNTKYSARV